MPAVSHTTCRAGPPTFRRAMMRSTRAMLFSLGRLSRRVNRARSARELLPQRVGAKTSAHQQQWDARRPVSGLDPHRNVEQKDIKPDRATERNADLAF